MVCTLPKLVAKHIFSNLTERKQNIYTHILYIKKNKAKGIYICWSIFQLSEV